MISIIVAISDNNAIGKEGQLLCHLPADMKHFKELTTGHTVIMGRKTFESLPKGALPNRKNVVLTTNENAEYANCIVCGSMQQALDICKDDESVFIIGGAHVYAEIIDRVERMYITYIHHVFEEADAYFPVVDFNRWAEIERQKFPADEKNPYPYTFVTYLRK